MIVGGLVAIHQHVRIGESAMLGGGAMVSQDVPPFCVAVGDRARLSGINVIGLTRRDVSRETISELRSAYRMLFQAGKPLRQALAEAETAGESGAAPSGRVRQFIHFVRSSERGVCRAVAAPSR